MPKATEIAKAVETAATEAVAAVETAVEHELVVVEGFLGYVKGQVITEAEKVKELLESEWEHHFVKKQKQPQEPLATEEPAAS